MERITELIRLARLFALAATPGSLDPVSTKGVALESSEQVAEHLLADAPAPARGQREVFVVARQVAGLLEPPSKRIERIQVTHRIGAKEVAHLVPIDRGEIVRAIDVSQ